MQMSGNTLIDLFERIKDLLKEERLEVVYSVASKQDLSIKLRETFKGLADMITTKNKERDFYAASIGRLIGHGHIDKMALANEYKSVGNLHKENVIALESYVTTFMNQLHAKTNEVALLRANCEELENRLREVEAERQSTEAEMQQHIGELRGERDAALWKMQQQLQAKQQELTQSNLIFADLKRKHDRIKQELQKQHIRHSNEMSSESSKLSSIIREKSQQLQLLKSRLNQKSSYFFTHSSILNQKLFILPKSLIDLIEEETGKRVKTTDRIYNYAQHSQLNFHNVVAKKENILLVCSIDQYRLVGAFTSASFSLQPEPHSTKSFLFGTKGEQISLNRLKPGRQSVVYDLDFWIFGNDQLCIEKGKNILTSYSHALSSQLHFQRPEKDFYFDTLGKDGKVELQNYEFFEVKFDQ